MRDDLEFAASVIHQARRSGEPVSVFASFGAVRKYGVGTDRFKQLMEDSPRSLVGVYDGKATPFQVAQDIAVTA